MSLETIVNSVRNYLASHFMNVDNEWLSGCVEYLTEDSSNNYSQTDIQNLAKEQWLLNDLKDICPGSLPANLKSLKKTALNGRFVLQINATVDIGTPAYQQYMKLQKVNMENIEATTKFDDKIPSHRMIKLYLTDGVQEVTAIEYKPMRNLSCDITPGCKILIKGPVECRRGVILLTESAIELLGGEVQELSVSNSLAGLLSSKLGVPIAMSQEPELAANNVTSRNTNQPTLHTQMPRPDQYDQPEQSRPIARVTSVQAAFTDDDIDIDQLAAIEAEIDIPSKNISSQNAQVDIHSKRTLGQNAQVDIHSKRTLGQNSQNDIQSKTTLTDYFSHTSVKRPLTANDNKPEKKLKIESENNIEDYPDDEDLFFEDDDYLREMEANFDAKESKINFPVTVSSEPFVYIKQIKDLSESDRAGRVFRVKGQIMKLLSKLSVGKDGWSLRCTIVDGTGSIDVDFTSGVLSKLVGFTPQEMNQLKKQMATKPELKVKAVSALQKAKDTLQVLYCIIELTMLEVPKITCLVPFEETHLELLRKRIQPNL